MRKLIFPLLNINPILPQGEFGSPRKYDVHTGIDLYCPEGERVLAIEDGLVKKVDLFTGEKAGSPWWNETSYVGIYGKSGYIVYGEIKSTLKAGDKVEAGQTIGYVKRVLKKDKGTSTSMLHLELYSTFVEDPAIWKLGDKKPMLLLNPSNLLFPQRFNHDCMNFEDAASYLKNRAKQLLHVGARIERIEPRSEGALAWFSMDDSKFISFYIYPDFRGNKTYKNIVLSLGLPVLTVDDCDIARYLNLEKIPHLVVDGLLLSEEYKLIESVYSNKTAKRSGAFLMDHIDEGLWALSQIGASPDAMKAFCLHPLLQSDSDLKKSLNELDFSKVSSNALILAMEYRTTANAYLSPRNIDSIDQIVLSPLKEVNDMLIADKVQNYKDFLKYHLGTHKNSDRLDRYFKNWFKKLGIPLSLLTELQKLDSNLDKSS